MLYVIYTKLFSSYVFTYEIFTQNTIPPENNPSLPADLWVPSPVDKFALKFHSFQK